MIDRKEIDDLMEEMARVGINGIDSLAMMLSLDDEDFNHLAPLVLEELRAALNNPTDRYQMALEQQMSGISHDKFRELMGEIEKRVDELSLPQNRKDFVKSILIETSNSIEMASSTSGKIFKVTIELCHPDAKIPVYSTDGAAGADVFAIEDCVIGPGETKILPLGFKLQIPVGYEVQIRPRSGLSSKTKLRIANSIGTLDADYRGLVGVIFDNIGDYAYTVTKGQRIAQMVLKEQPRMAFVEGKVNETVRGNGGFGSTGK